MLLFFLMNYCFFLECLSIAKQDQNTPEHPETPPEHSRSSPEYTGTILRRAGHPGTTSVTNNTQKTYKTNLKKQNIINESINIFYLQLEIGDWVRLTNSSYFLSEI